MLQKTTYSNFKFFGILIFGGVAFVWVVVPEIKRLTLEEMDVLFGSGLLSLECQAFPSDYLYGHVLTPLTLRTLNAWEISKKRSGWMLPWRGLAWEGRRLMMRRLVVEVRVARAKAMGKLERLRLWGGFILRMESMRSQKAAVLHEDENEMHGTRELRVCDWLKSRWSGIGRE